MLAAAQPPVQVVVLQHVENAAVLRQTRSVLTRAPHVRLHLLRRLDERLAASLDGLLVAGEYGRALSIAALEAPGRGPVFAAAVLAIEGRDDVLLDRLLALAEAVPDATAGLVSAFGWVSAESLRGLIGDMLVSPVAFRRWVGIAACGFHQVDPGQALDAALVDANEALRMRALRIAGELGRQDLLQHCIDGLRDADAGCRFQAARAAALLGGRHAAIQQLRDTAYAPGPHDVQALALLLKLGTPEQMAPLLQEWFGDHPDGTRTLVKGLGVVGDPKFVPWLIDQMSDPALSRLAGESFSTITGLDLAWLDLECKPPQDVEPGPGDDPEDDNVAMDEDESLPWPDPGKVAAWWQSHGHRFPMGQRFFMGEPPDAQNCRRVLRHGGQRQRIAAAEHLCLLEPGTRLFPSNAPAWQQQRRLDAMGA